MYIDIKSITKYILIPLILGALAGFLSGSFGGYKDMVMPSFAPPGILFPIVWSILYILMGVSRYIISQKDNNSSAVSIYRFQLGVNLLWSFFFFTFRWYLFSFLWIILLIILVLIMIKKFYNISKVASFLQIPYLVWIVFASILNFSIYYLN